MAISQNPPPTGKTIARLPAIDAMRGLVMVLMALDHASHAFNVGRYTRDSFMWYPTGAEIPAVQFFVRWVTHLCAPTFLFLAGIVLALSTARRLSRGEPQSSIDISLLIRGFFILLLDPLWMSIGFGEGTVLQVLYAIGGSFCLMIPLRRLGMRSLFAIGLVILVFGEALAVWAGIDQKPGLMGTFLVTGGPVTQGVYVLYPLLPWFAYMILGWVCGAYMLQNKNVNPVRFVSLAGIFSLTVFLIVRGFNQYGNMLLYRYDNSIPQWLHVSKYPPSLSFAALELGLMFLMLAVLFAWYRKRKPSPANPLQVFGRTPLFFYILHVHLLAVFAWTLKLYRAAGLVETGLATLVVLVVLYPFCRIYGRFKRAHPKSLLRYL